MRWNLVFAVVGCAPVLDDDTPYVSDPRVLAVRVEPAEVLPGEEVVLTALYADSTGALDTAPLDWSFCPIPKSQAELGPVSRRCLDPESPDLLPIGSGIEVQGAVPSDVCSLFGPNPPPPQEGEPSGRPTDPDVTGGYHQPVVSFLDDGTATLSPVRVRCGIANVSQETYIAWNQGYLSNVNPAVEVLEMVRGSKLLVVPPDGTEAPLEVPAGDRVTLRVRWPGCPDAPTEGCAGAETFGVYDAESATLITRREAVSATWFATGGTFDVARNGRDGGDVETGVENGWTAPDTGGDVWLAVVLRDERGGVDFSSYRVSVPTSE